MRFKTILIFLVGIALGGALFWIFTGSPNDREETPPPLAAGKPEWMAAPPADPQGPAAREAQDEAEDRALIVGVIGPETGTEAKYGLAVLEGVVMAADQFNARGGVRGEKIEIIHQDNSGGSGQALDIVSAMIEKKVVAIFSAPTGWSTFAPTHLVNQSRTLFISVGTRRKIGRSGDYIFHFSLPDEIAVEALLDYATRKMGYENFALVTSSSYDYSLSIASVFKQTALRIGSRILVEADTYNTFSGMTDIGNVLAALKASPEELQAIIFTGSALEAGQLARAAKDNGLNLPLIGSEDLFSEQFLSEAGNAAQGALVYATFAPDHPSPMVAEFIADHVDRNKVAPDRFTALAYDAFGLLSEALEVAGSLNGRRVRDALVNMKETDGVTGASRLAPDGTPIKHPHLYRVDSDKSGEKFVLVLENGE